MEERGEILFSDISGDDYQKPQEIESLCPNCGKNGITRILLTRIPHYKEVILMSFNCDECGYQNNEIQSGGQIQEKGIVIEVHLTTERDLSRQVVKSDYASITVPEIDLEIPSNSQKGEITTIEGILSRTMAGLEQDQPVRKHMDPDGYEKIEKFTAEIQSLLKLENDFKLIINDPSGNSHIENPHLPAADPGRMEKHYQRTNAQNHKLGIYTDEEINSDKPIVDDDELTAEKLEEEVLHFSTNCPNCNAPAQTNMKVTNIPFFKEVVIMATVCDLCDIKTNEVKSGGGIEPKGKRITMTVTEKSDLNRDVLKSETCDLKIPELEFEMGGAALGGKFTTLEGLLNNMLDEIEQNSLWGSGDGAAPDVADKMKKFKARLRQCIEGDLEFTIVLDDPAGNSYLQNLYAPDPDPGMLIEEYERTFEQNDDLGINDMKVENYQEDS